MHLLILKVNHLGDNVVFLPVVQALRRLYPGWKLTVVTAPSVAALYAADIPRDDLLLGTPDAFKTAWRRPAEFAGWWSRLAARKFDASLVSYDQGSVAHALAFVAGGKPRVGGGGLKIRLRHTLTHEVAWNPAWSMAKWNWEMGRTLVAQLDPRAQWPVEPPAPDLTHFVGRVQMQPGRVLIHAGSKQAHTRWPLGRFADLADRLSRRAEVVWLDTAETLGATLTGAVTRRETASLQELCGEIARAQLFVGNNSGPMHLASALGTSGVILSGASAFAWDPAWNRDRFQVMRTPGLACLPCEQGPYSPGRCLNLAEPLACLQRWSVDAVEAACLQALGEPVRELRS